MPRRRSTEELRVTSIKVPVSKHKLWKEVAGAGGMGRLIIQAMDQYIDSLYAPEEEA